MLVVDSLVLVVSLLSGIVVANPVNMDVPHSPARRMSPTEEPRWGSPCHTLQKRVEWRKLTKAQRTSWISAVKCLTTKPAQVTQGVMNPKPTRHYDDLVYTHADQARKTHGTAAFLPWHRWFVWLHYQALTRCGYDGPTTYWDFELDHADPAHAPVFSHDPKTGFGGDGTGALMSQGETYAGRVVQDGAFANWTLQWPAPHALTRNFKTPDGGGPDAGFLGSNYYTPSAIDSLMSNTVYEPFHVGLEGDTTRFRGTPQFRNGAHGGLHEGINGEMWHILGVNMAPNDPIFFPMHGGVDRLWWKWQQADRAKRFFPSPAAYNGNVNQNSSANDATIHDVMSFNGLIPNVTTGSSINTELYPLCYTY